MIEVFVRRYSTRVASGAQKTALQKPRLFTEQFSQFRGKYNTPHYPIVLCHGFLGFDKLSFVPSALQSNRQIDELAQQEAERAATGNNGNGKDWFLVEYWYGIRDSLEKLGSTVLIGKVPPFGTIKERATILDMFIDKECKELRKSESKASIYNNENNHHASHTNTDTFKDRDKPIKINLISHSMGGLDSRYLISKLQDSNKNYQVVSLTTVSTPHHGSECADFIVDAIGNGKLSQLVCPQSVYELTTTSMVKFNETVLDDPSVQYFSYGARFDPKWYNVFNLTWNIMKYKIEARYGKANADRLKQMIIDNDGVVSVESSKWGEYLGTLDQVDHLDLINWTNKARKVVDKLVFNEDPKFNALALYLDIADNLAKKGF